MFEVIKGVIYSGGYKLSELRHKIQKLYVLGDLTEEQMEELLVMASTGISADAERPELLSIVKNLSERLNAVEERLKALEGGNTETDTEATDHPAWKPWDGVSADYQNGAVVSHNGELWESVFGGQNVWEPGTAGTEGLWVKYTPKA